jgi:hypothetical protein
MATLTAGWAIMIPSRDLPNGFYSETNSADWSAMTVAIRPTTSASALHLKVISGTLALQNFFNAGTSGAMQRCEVYAQPVVLWVDGPRTETPDFPNVLYGYQQYYPSSSFISDAKVTQHIAPPTTPYWSIQSGAVGSEGILHTGEMTWYGTSLGTGRYAVGLYFWIKDRQCHYGNGDWRWTLNNFRIDLWQIN